jgi:outer membrane protein TolC
VEVHVSIRSLTRVLAAWCALALVAGLTVPVAAQAPATQAPATGQTPRAITLSEALTLAAQNNLALKVAVFESQVARAQLAQAESIRSGTVMLTGSYTRINDRSPSTITIPAAPPTIPAPLTITLPATSSDLFATALTYQVPLMTGGRIESQIALARANVKGADAALERAKQQLVFDVKQAYFQVLLAQASVDVAVRTMAAAEENLRVARARVAAGASPRFDEIQAEVNFANARQGVIRSRNQDALAQHGLNAITNLPLDTALAPRETMTLVTVRGDAPALIRRALEARPELAELRARLEAATAAIEIARSGGRPALVLSAGPNYGNAVSGSATGTTAAFGWSVTLAATVPLFDGGLTTQRVREAELRVEQLRVNESQLRQAVELDVRRALLTYASAAEELITADKTVEQAQEGLRIANVRFAAGVSTNLEVIQAQAAQSQAEANRILALFNVNVARAQLERAAGGSVE